MPGLTDAPRRPAPPPLRTLHRLATEEYVAALSVSRGGSLAAVGLGDGRWIAFDPDSGERRADVRAHRHGLFGVDVSPDGRRVVSCGAESVARLWSADGTAVAELDGGGAWVEKVAFAPSSGRVAIAAGKQVRIFDADGALTFASEALASTVTALAWRADGSGVAATCYGGVHLFPLVPGARAKKLAFRGSLISLALSPDGKLVACGSQDASVHFWRIASGQDSEMTGYPLKPTELAFDHESKLLATSGDSTVSVWDFRGKGPEGTRPIQLRGLEGACSRLAFAPRASRLASGSRLGEVVLFEPRRGEAPIGAARLDEVITGLAFLPDGRRLVGADASGGVAVWEAP